MTGRGFKFIVWLCLASALSATVLINYFNQQARNHDQGLLSDIHRMVYFAQTALYETGNLPETLNALNITVRSQYPDLENTDVIYEKTGASELLLCGDFKRSTTGQEYLEGRDFRLSLAQDLTGPRERKGDYCYRIKLDRLDDNIRHDALLYREINEALTIIECEYWAKGDILSLKAAKKVSRSMRDRRVCSRHRNFLGKTRQVLNFSPASANSIRVCADFRAAYIADVYSSVFDPARNSQYPELYTNRSSPGEYCYGINFLKPDPAMPEPLITWTLPYQHQIAPEKLTEAQENDKRAIGDMSNMLRLARCAFSLGDGLPDSFEAALAQVRSRPEALARRYQCDWAPGYYGQSSRKAEVSYKKNGPDQIQVCANFSQAWDNPVALNYYGRAVHSWPTGLHELQKPVTGPGKHCVDARLTPIGSGKL